MAIIPPDLYNEIIALANELAERFAQPEFIPGCVVKDITDINLYATNNGWIEALCGQHNQQRVRWKSDSTVAVNDYIDVLYFANRRLFEAWGVGGSTAVGGAYIPKSLIDAKGDFIVGSAADTAARLALSGNDGWVLTEDSAEALGVKWAAAGAGATDMIQVRVFN